MNRRSGIQARMVFALLMACVPALLGFGAYAAYHVNQEKKAAIERLRQQARSIASTRGVLLDQTQALLRSLASLPQLRNMKQKPQACSEVLAWALKMSDQYANIGAADMEGRLICRGLALETKQPVGVADRAWFQRVVERQRFVLGNYAIGKASGERSIHTAYPIFDDHRRMIGAVSAGIRLSWLGERVAALNLPRGILVALLDSDGTILLRHPRAEQASLAGSKVPDIARLIAKGGSGIAEAKMLDDVHRTVAIEPLDGIGLSDITVVVAADAPFLAQSAWRLVSVHGDSVLVLLFGVFGAILGAYWIVVRPVHSLEAAMNAYALGDHAMRAKNTEQDELGHLAGAFNAMAERLNQQESVLREASAQKSRYLAIASHDLRQPLQIVMMGLESGIENSGGKVRAGLQRSQRAAERLKGQLDLLANVVRADLAGVEPPSRIHAVRIAEVLRRVGEAHRQTAAAKGIALRVVESSLIIASDPDALLTIVNNLVMNAINYTEKGRVVIGCRRLGRMCRIEVHDTGPGIPPESRSKIFEAFHRLKPETGTGLGLELTIVQETAAVLGHTVSVHSELGRGSCFCVEAPIWTGVNPA